MNTIPRITTVFKNPMLGIGVILGFRAVISYSTPSLELLRNPSEINKFLVFLKNGASLLNVVLGICIFLSFKILDYATNKSGEIAKYFTFAWFTLGCIYLLSILNSLEILLIKHLPQYIIISIVLIFVFSIKSKIKIQHVRIILTNLIQSRVFKTSKNDFPFLILTVFILRLLISPITSTDSIFYWTGLADRWVKTWPAYPNAFGPGLGSDMSFNYLNLNSGIITFISLALKISPMNATNLLSVFVISTIFVSLKKFKIQNERWIFLLILSISGLQQNLFGKTGYTILFALSFLFASQYQSQAKPSKYIFFIPATISLIGPIGLPMSAMMSLILIFNSNDNLLRKIKQTFITYVPLLIGILVLFARSHSMLYPFIVWPRRFDPTFLSTLENSKQLVFNNSLISLDVDPQLNGAIYILYKYLLVGSIFSGGILFLIFSAYKFREKNRNTSSLINFSTIFILILFISELYWQRYLLGIMGIYLAILCAYFAKNPIRMQKNISQAIVLILVLKYMLIIGGINLDSFQSSNNKVSNEITFQTYDKAMSLKSNRIREFGSAAQAWSDLSRRMNRGQSIYLLDEIGASILDNQNQLVNSEFPKISKSANGASNLNQFMLRNKKSYIFINGQSVSQENVGRYVGRNTFDKVDNMQFKPCSTWPANKQSAPNVLWKLNNEAIECGPQVIYALREDEINDISELGNKFTDQNSKIPKTIHASFVTQKSGNYLISFESKLRNYYRELDPINFKSSFRENVFIRIKKYQGLNMTPTKLQLVSFTDACNPIDKLCKIAVSVSKPNEIIQLDFIGFTDMKYLKILEELK